MSGAGEHSAAPFRSGFVALVGRPNVGKSTLVNALVGQKVAIVSNTPQTTRNRIAGVVTGEDYQLVLLDLPGFQKPRDLLTERMQIAVNMTLQEVDLILFMVNAAEAIGGGDRYVAAAAFASSTPVITVVNKVDLVKEQQLLPQIDEAAKLGDFEELFPISAAHGRGLDRLKEKIVASMPEGPMYFPADTVSDQPERAIAGELVREQAVRLTREEVPHAVAVEVERMEQRPGKALIDMSATILVETDSQKKILIGKQGSMIKDIGSRARREIEALLGSKVYLELTVRVKKRWRDDERILGDLGL